jgi:acyl-CoA synthetase (AMP-forming)/AMP-acid ligase II
LRPDIWEQFQTRFNIPQIGEFYAATEGNATVINTENKKTAVGFVS